MDEVRYGPNDEAEPEFLGLAEAAFRYDARPKRPELNLVPVRVKRPAKQEKGGGKMKTSVYLEPCDVRRLGWLASVEDRSQAEIIRAAIRAYAPKVDAEFELFGGSAEDDALRTKPLDAELDQFQAELDSLLDGFGEDDPR
jgi:Ribbon-helix-helix protein, copG family